MDIRDRTFLVAGGASGLGEATTVALVERGARVVVADLAGEAPDGAVLAVTDVTSEEQVAAAVETAVGLGRFSGVVNCAGVAAPTKVLSSAGVHSLEKFARTVEINLVGTFNVTRLAADALSGEEPGPDGERGVIINTASGAAFDGQIGQTAYAASKAGVAGMTLPLARELASHGIRAVTIAPGLFGTPMVANSLSADVQAALGAQVPFPSRLGDPAEFASLALPIVENRMLNGEVIRLDGSLRMAPK